MFVFMMYVFHDVCAAADVQSTHSIGKTELAVLSTGVELSVQPLEHPLTRFHANGMMQIQEIRNKANQTCHGESQRTTAPDLSSVRVLVKIRL